MAKPFSKGILQNYEKSSSSPEPSHCIIHYMYNIYIKVLMDSEGLKLF